MNKHRLSLVVWAAIALGLAGCTSVTSPQAIATADRTEGYPPLQITFDGSASLGTDSEIVSYRWTFDDHSSADSAIATHTFETKGVYVVTLTVTDADGKLGATSTTIRVLNRVPHANFRISPFGAPRDYPVQFDASESYDPDGEIVSYVWDFGDGTSAEGERVSHIFPRQQTEYLVTLTVTDEDGASNNSVRTVVVLGCDTCG